jgi:hypothetical protein
MKSILAVSLAIAVAGMGFLSLCVWRLWLELRYWNRLRYL